MNENSYWEYRMAILNKIISCLSEYYSNGLLRCDDSIKEYIVNSLELPYINDGEAITNPFILFEFLAYQYLRIHEKIDDEFENKFRSIEKQFHNHSNYIRIRLFNSNNGIYYPQEFLSNDCMYFIDNNEPILITKTTTEWLDEESSPGNELGWIIRPEVQALSALSFTLKDYYCVFNVSKNPIDVPVNLILDNNSTLSKSLIPKIRSIILIMQRINKEYYGNNKTEEFLFRNFNFSRQEKANEFFNNFNIADDLTIRTCFLFLKAAMLLHQNLIFGEDALLNFYMGIEGCLRLIYKRHNKNNNFDIEKTKIIINNIFPYDGYSQSLSSFYEDRVNLVHPESKFNSNWSIPFMVDDFVDNYQWLLELLYYSVTGKFL